jgi:hypothetical protein
MDTTVSTAHTSGAQITVTDQSAVPSEKPNEIRIFAHMEPAGYELVHEDELKRLRERAQWIPVSERMPEDGQRCIIYRPDSHLPPNYDPNVTIKEFRAISGEFTMCSVQPTHWMPLPQPPEGKEG